MTRTAAALIVAALLVNSCESVPTGPGVMVLPGTGKSLDQFQGDDVLCRQWAMQQTGITPKNAAAETAASGAAIGIAVGAGAGSPATGAAVGAGVDLPGGTATGVSSGFASGLSAQERYDIRYMQCMYAKGNQTPVPAGSQSPAYTSTVPQPPPPPAGPPPPAPTGPLK